MVDDYVKNGGQRTENKGKRKKKKAALDEEDRTSRKGQEGRMLITTHIPPTLLSPFSELYRKGSSLAPLPPIRLIPLPSHSELAPYLQMRRSPNTQLHISFTLS
jgi:hypothetical protein